MIGHIEDRGLVGYAYLGKELLRYALCDNRIYGDSRNRPARLRNFAESPIIGLICDVWEFDEERVKRAILRRAEAYEHIMHRKST